MWQMTEPVRSLLTLLLTSYDLHNGVCTNQKFGISSAVCASSSGQGSSTKAEGMPPCGK